MNGGGAFARSLALAVGCLVGALPTEAAPRGGVVEAFVGAQVGHGGSTALHHGAESCTSDGDGSLAHVRLGFRDPHCVFTVAEARGGITFAYDLTVEQPIPGFVPATLREGVEAGNLELREVVEGNGQRYCDCDHGRTAPRCPGRGGAIPSPTCPPVTLAAGTWHRTFTWHGRNWGGRSDTGNPEGAPFPPGRYDVTVSTNPGSLGGRTDVGQTARLHIVIVP